MFGVRDISAILKRFDDDLRAASLSNGQASRHWEKRCNEIKRDADSQSVFDFARWPSLSEISVTAEAVPQQWLEEMEADPAWNWRWYQLTRDNYIGNPKPYGDMRWTSPVLIEHTYNLFQYEKRTGQSLLDCDVLFEIGGGYGSFCRLMLNAGFDGFYSIYDLPHLLAIQRMFLTWNGFNEAALVRQNMPRKAFGLNDDRSVGELFGNIQTIKSKNEKMKIGVVATWSLSEMPLEKRQRIMDKLLPLADRFLLSYQPKYEDIDNVAYFDSVRLRRPDLRWWSWLEQHQGSYSHQSSYLVA